MASYLQIDNLSKRYGDLVLFENISFVIEEGQKTALIARNGAGKTSLLNILSGEDGPDNGSVIFLRDIRIGFLPQEPVLDENKTVLEQVFASTSSVVQAIKEYEAALESHDKDRLQKAMETMDFHQAWDFEQKIKQMLSVLKITDFDQPIRQLSGGQRKRVALASALIEEPDFLILDEPTNHLDLDMIEWLEEFLIKSSCALLMVTHDRYFLDRVCTEMLELDDKTIYPYKGNYSYYLEKREERILNQQANIDKARNLMRKELDWMRRQPQARGTKAKYRIDAFYELSEKASQQRSDKRMNIDVKAARMGSKVVDIHGLSKAFGNKELLDGFSYKFAPGEKIGVVGNNGTGKSTFLNLVTGALKADSGTIEVGETIVFGYYRQEEFVFDENQRVIDVVTDISEVVTLGDGSTMGVSQFLNYFLFSYEMQYTFVYKLSVGEKRRLYLCTVLMRNPNFLILDEPTNHLDILTLNVLEDYLQQFKGCVLIVTHDRFFMDKVVDHLFVFQGEGRIKDFPGNYSDYRDFKIEQERELKKQLKANTVKPESSIPPSIVQKRKASYKEKKEYEELSKEIEEYENEKSKLEEQLSSGTMSNEDLLDKSNRISTLINLIDVKTERWLELSEIVEG